MRMRLGLRHGLGLSSSSFWCSECQPYTIILFAQTRFVPSVSYYVGTDRVCLHCSLRHECIYDGLPLYGRGGHSEPVFCTGRLEIESSCSYPETAFCG